LIIGVIAAVRDVTMVDQLILALTLLSALGCGLVAGAFFAFSSFVMKALARLPPAQGLAAMQSINVVVLNPWFLGVFAGTAAACVLAVICAFLRWHERSAIYLLLGGALYLIGTFAVTAVFNVPRNDALAKLAPDDPAARVCGPNMLRAGRIGTMFEPWPRSWRPHCSALRFRV
jgi:uncharacterized membrane protein